MSPCKLLQNKTVAEMAWSCEESNRPCKHNTSGKSQKVEEKRFPMAIRREVGTKPMHLDTEIGTVSPS